jgi:hypothetical protein
VLEFMVISAPRSGSAWCSNWLTTEHTHCVHDPLMHTHYSEWDRMPIADGKKLGVACTGIAVVAPEVLRGFPARKAILHRPLEEINRSLARLGLPRLSGEWKRALDDVPGMHCDWRELFENPERIWVYLTGTPFDPERHDALKRLHVEVEPRRAQPNPKVWRRLIGEIRGETAA